MSGREYDTEIDLYYYRARYYDSGTGRFISQDPIGFDAGDTNLYRYVNNSPTNATDPSGEVILIQAAIGASLGASVAGGLGLLTGMACGQLEVWGLGAQGAQAREIIDTKAFEGLTVGAAIGAVGGALFGAFPSLLSTSLLTIHLPLTANFISFSLALPGIMEAYNDKQHPNLFMSRLLCLGSEAAIEWATGFGFKKIVDIAEIGGAKNIPVPEGHTRVYRVVSEAEYQDILKHGELRQGPNSLEGKWFADNLDGARLHGAALEGAGNFRIIEVDVPNDAPGLFRQPNLDGRGPARYLDLQDLKDVVPRLVEGG